MRGNIAARLAGHLRLAPCTLLSSTSVGTQKATKSWFSTWSYEGENDSKVKRGTDEASFECVDDDDDIRGGKSEIAPQGVNPGMGWGNRGVHKAIICGKIGQTPVQKILRNGRTVTIFTVGTGGMYDQRAVANNNSPKPAQWHRVAVHQEALGSYAVQKLVKNSSVYVEGDIEVRVYNDSINGEVKNIPEICVRRDGRLRLIRSGESISSISFNDLREDLA